MVLLQVQHIVEWNWFILEAYWDILMLHQKIRGAWIVQLTREAECHSVFYHGDPKNFNVLKKIYHYIFYVLYKLAAKSSTIFPKDFVAFVGLLALTVWGGSSLINEFYVITKIRVWPTQIK